MASERVLYGKGNVTAEGIEGERREKDRGEGRPFTGGHAQKDDTYWRRQVGGGKQPTAQTPQSGEDRPENPGWIFTSSDFFFQKKVKLRTETLNNFQRPRLRCQSLENENESKTVVKIS